MSNEDVGVVTRRLRQGANLTLKQLSDISGLSQSFLSQFERGQSQASITSLRLIAESLGVDLNDLFAVGSSGSLSVSYAHQRQWMSFGDKAKKKIISSPTTSRFEAFEVSFEVGGSTGSTPYSHSGHEEMIIVTEGTVGIEVGAERALLEVGDSASFNSKNKHRVSNIGGTVASIIWTVSPPVYLKEDPLKI